MNQIPANVKPGESRLPYWELSDASQAPFDRQDKPHAWGLDFTKL